MLPAILASTVFTTWPEGAAKQKQVQNICTCTARAHCTPAPFFIRRQVGLARCTHVPSLVSLAQSFLKPEDPSSKRFSAPGACNLHPTEVAPLKDFKLVRYACGLRVWNRWRHPCAPQGREKMMRSKDLHVHCTITMHPSPFFIRRQVGLDTVHPCTEFGIASSKFTFTGGPTSKHPLRPWRVELAPHRNMDFKLVQYACDL